MFFFDEMRIFFLHPFQIEERASINQGDFMDKVIRIGPGHLPYLHPLVKWRAMDLKSLRAEASLAHKENNFYRIIRYLEAQGVIKTWRDPFSGRKYAYLTPEGQKACWGEENSVGVSTETLLHDIKVSEIARTFLVKHWAAEVELEHEYSDKRVFASTRRVIPDAIFHVFKDGKRYRIAFELELTRKKIDRILYKAREYRGDLLYYNYVLYLFADDQLRNSYYRLIREHLDCSIGEKFMFFSHNGLLKKDVDLGAARGIFNDKEQTLGELMAPSFGK